LLHHQNVIFYCESVLEIFASFDLKTFIYKKSTNIFLSSAKLAKIHRKISRFDDEASKSPKLSHRTLMDFPHPTLINSLTINSVFANRAEHHGFLLTTTRIRVVPDIPWCWEARLQWPSFDQ
jgi:hypothetical protein